MRTLEHGVIALPATTHSSDENRLVGEQISTGLPNEAPGAQISFIRAETLGFFQLAVSYGVDVVVSEQLYENWNTRSNRRGIRPDFYRDLHITNRYLNTSDATYSSIMPYAGVRSKQASQQIVRKTLAHLHDNFPWDQVSPDMIQRYPRDLVVHGKTKSYLSSEGRKSISASTQQRWKDPEFRKMMSTAISQANTGKVKSEETKALLREYWDSERRQEQSNRLTGQEVSPETRKKISQSKLGKPRPDIKGKKRSDEEIQNMRDGQKRRKELNAMREAGIDTTALEEEWKEERRVKKCQNTRRWTERQRIAKTLKIQQPSDSLPQTVDVFDASKH